MKVYNVLWFDDEFATLETITDSACQKNINLVGFSNAKDGLSELKHNLPFYDAVLVDGKFHADRDDTGDSLTDNALFSVARFLDKLEDRKKMPWFILSGQISFTKEVNRIADEYKSNKVYNKNNDEDFDSLWNDIISEADKQIETQIRHRFNDAFEVCTLKYIGEPAAKDLLQILIKEITPFNDDSEKYFTPLRKILEDIFRACNQHGLLPDAFIDRSVALNESSKFLSGYKEKGYALNLESQFPYQIGKNIQNILSIVQPGSHRSHLDNYLSELKTPYLLFSITYLLMDVLVWLKKHIDSKPLKENWVLDEMSERDISRQPLTSVDGIVINMNLLKGYAFFKPDNGGTNIFIPPPLIEEHNLHDHRKISVQIEDYIDNRSGEPKQRVKTLTLSY